MRFTIPGLAWCCAVDSEAKYFLLLGLNVPASALAVYKRAEAFRTHAGNLELIVNMCNSIDTTLLSVERPLLKVPCRHVWCVRSQAQADVLAVVVTGLRRPPPVGHHESGRRTERWTADVDVEEPRYRVVHQRLHGSRAVCKGRVAMPQAGHG